MRYHFSVFTGSRGWCCIRSNETDNYGFGEPPNVGGTDLPDHLPCLFCSILYGLCIPLAQTFIAEDRNLPQTSRERPISGFPMGFGDII